MDDNDEICICCFDLEVIYPLIIAFFKVRLFFVFSIYICRLS